MDVIRSFEQYGQQMLDLLPGFAAGLAVLLIGWLLAKLVRNLVGRMLKKAGLDDGAEKVGIAGVLRQIGIHAPASAMLSTLLYWLLMLAIIMASTDIMGVEAISGALATFLSYLPRFFTAFAIVLIGALIADKIRMIVATMTESIGLSGGKVMANMLYAIIMIFVVITALNMAGIDTTLVTSNIVLIVGAALVAFSIAYGFASRDILKNVLSSFYSKDRFQIGQRIRIGDVEGTIEKIDSQTITIDTGKTRIMIPCSELITQRIELLSVVNTEGDAQ